MKNKIKLARLLAQSYHINDTYSNHPYVYHLDKVYNVLLRFGIVDKDILCAAFLHDVLEDTDVPADVLLKYFGQDILDIVLGVTEPKTGSRKERHKETYPRTRKNVKSVILKLADRIANIEELQKSDMYKKEHEFFRKILFKDDDATEVLQMWNYLDTFISRL